MKKAKVIELAREVIIGNGHQYGMITVEKGEWVFDSGGVKMGTNHPEENAWYFQHDRNDATREEVEAMLDIYVDSVPYDGWPKALNLEICDESDPRRLTLSEFEGCNAKVFGVYPNFEDTFNPRGKELAGKPGYCEAYISNSTLCADHYFQFDDGKNFYAPPSSAFPMQSVRIIKNSEITRDDPASVLYHGTRYVNLTPHPVDLYLEDGTHIRWDSCQGEPARLKEISSSQAPGKGLLDINMPHREIEFTGVSGLPDQKEKVAYIISLPMWMGMVSAGIFRPDCVAPDTGEGAVRDGKGRIIGTKGWVMVTSR